MSSPAPGKLQQVLGLGFGLAGSVGGTIGAGILADLSAWLLGGLYAGLRALCVAELASSLPRAGIYPPEITRRMASGYFVAEGFPGMKNLDGADVKAEDMSWGGAAGAAVSRPEEVNRWVRALFSSNELLNAAARKELTQVVSMRTGETLAQLTPDDPRGFGLGVSGFVLPTLGAGWQYEGESMGYRTLYLYLPGKDLVVTVALNSGVEGEADHACGPWGAGGG